MSFQSEYSWFDQWVDWDSGVSNVKRKRVLNVLEPCLVLLREWLTVRLSSQQMEKVRIRFKQGVRGGLGTIIPVGEEVTGSVFYS